MGSSNPSAEQTLAALPTYNRYSDVRRNQVLWLALSVLGLLALAFTLVVAYGEAFTSADYTEPLLLIGLLALVTCTVAYFGDKERQYRWENRSLIQQLHDANQALDARVARLLGLCDTSANLLGAEDAERVMQLAVDALLEQLGADLAAFALRARMSRQRLKAVTAGPTAQDEAESARIAAIAAEAMDQREPLVRPLSPHTDSAKEGQVWRASRYAVSAPVSTSSALVGGMAAARSRQFDEEEVAFLSTLANIAARAIDTADLNQQLRGCYYRTLRVLSRSLAVRDPYSMVHGEAVTWLACRLATALGAGSGEMSLLEEYAPLHDLGKIGVPDRVLLKQGPLTQEERETCRQHTVIGETIVRPFTSDPRILAMVRSHHEHWDGSGYPDGLSGERIHLLARIVAVADAFHAIVSSRPYRGGLIPDQALHEMQALSGTRFDPRVVEALSMLWRRGDLAKFIVRFGQPDQTAEEP